MKEINKTTESTKYMQDINILEKHVHIRLTPRLIAEHYIYC
jgi:hypothetical protein